MSADRTLLAILRTSLALIGFGFTIFKFFQELAAQLGAERILTAPARNFGLVLVVLGVGLLVAGLHGHRRSIAELQARREALHAKSLLSHGPRHRISPTGVVSLLLLLVGLLVILGIMVRAGPFG